MAINEQNDNQHHMTIFSAIRQCINNAKLNSTISRQELFDYAWKTYGYMETYASVDSIRRTLTKLGYIESAGRGIYKICKHIPEHLNTSDIRELAYGKPASKIYAKAQICIAEQTKSKPTILALLQQFAAPFDKVSSKDFVKYCHSFRQDVTLKAVITLFKKLCNAKLAVQISDYLTGIELLADISNLTLDKLDSLAAKPKLSINRDVEYILCAAIKRNKPRDCKPYWEGTNDICSIELGFRHHDIIMRFPDELQDCCQGFYTSFGRFVDRYEGMEVAFKAGQVSAETALSKAWHDIDMTMTDCDGRPIAKDDLIKGDTHRYNQLFSEDLYGGY